MDKLEYIIWWLRHHSWRRLPLVGLKVKYKERKKEQEEAFRKIKILEEYLPTFGERQTNFGMALLGMGFSLGLISRRYPRLRQVTFPKSWRIARNDIDMILVKMTGRVMILDHKNRERLKIRVRNVETMDCQLEILRRFYVDIGDADGPDEPLSAAHVRDRDLKAKQTSDIIYSSEPFDLTGEEETVDILDTTDPYWYNAEDWLDEHYPDWRDPFAYWDDPPPA
jgi:hypothetical protein